MLSVLYVDDEPVLLDATKQFLEKGGSFKVDTSTSAREALEKIRGQAYDVIVSDYQMPEMDGIGFLKEVRSTGNQVPFIIFTGKGREDVVVEVYNAGADSYIVKGGEPRLMFLDLSRAIGQAVSRRRMEDELKFRNILLATEHDVSPDGILVVGETGRILSFNNRFLKMWDVPPGLVAPGDDKPLLDHNLGMVLDPEEFLRKVRYLYEHRTETSQDEIRLKDKRTFDRYTAPMTGPGGEYYGRVWYFRDVTEKKRAGAALLESAEKYRTLIESANEAIFIIQDGIITYSNPRSLALIGLPEEEVQIHTFLDFVHPDDRAEAFDRHKKRLNGEKLDPKAEMRIIDKAGAVHWLEIDAVPIQWNGWPATLNFATDVTKRKEAQLALEENEAKFREIFNNINDSIEIHEIEKSGLPGRYIEVNDVACRMLQYTRDELLKKSPMDIVTGYHSIPVGEIGRKFLSLGHALFETEYRRKDGTVFPVEVNGHVMHLAGKKVVLAVTRDITGRRKQERAIRESEERFKQIAENAGEWIWEVDAEGIFTYSSPVVETILGYPPEELVGRKHFYDLFAQEERERRKKSAFATISRREAFRGLVHVYLHRNGGEIFLESTGSPILDSKGRFTGYRGADTDITARIQAERALRKSLEEKELLLKEIHHRVKNNLQTISSLLYLQSLSTENTGQLAVLREARARVTAMGLIHQKLYQSADIATIPFLDFVQSLIEFLQESYGVDQDRIRIEIDVQPPDLSLDIDTGIPCGMLINELVTNALKYAFRDRAGGMIRIRITRNDIRQYTLSVSDDGTGLPADFDPASAKTLGMTLIAGLVDQLDGSLEFARGPGTTVTIRFSTEMNVSEPTLSGDPSGRRKTEKTDAPLVNISPRAGDTI